jgi:hypothetical protein
MSRKRYEKAMPQNCYKKKGLENRRTRIRVMRMRRLFALGLSILFSDYCSAGTFGHWEYLVNNDEIILTKYNGNESSIEIPDQIGSLPVRQISVGPEVGYISGTPDFTVFGHNEANWYSITNILIPSSVRRIEQWAFSWLTNLESITIPSSVTSLGDGVFYRTGLTNLIIPNSVTNIGIACFQGSTNLKTITLPSNITNISGHMFAWCKLQNINIPPSVKSIGPRAFWGNTTLTSIGSLKNVEHIGTDAFAGCFLLTHISGLRPQLVSQYAAIGFSSNTVLSDIKITDLIDNQSEGREQVKSNPNSYNLYTTNQILDMKMGGMMITRTSNNLILNYKILQSENLNEWTIYSDQTLPITNAPTNKLFLRVQAVGQ